MSYALSTTLNAQQNPLPVNYPDITNPSAIAKTAPPQPPTAPLPTALLATPAVAPGPAPPVALVPPPDAVDPSPLLI